MTITHLALTAEQCEALTKAASNWHAHVEHCALIFPLQRDRLNRCALVLEGTLALLQAQPANAAEDSTTEQAGLQPVLLALREALRAAAAHAELFTGRGVQEPPPAWAIKPDGDYDAEQIATTARAALLRMSAANSAETQRALLAPGCPDSGCEFHLPRRRCRCLFARLQRRIDPAAQRARPHRPAHSRTTAVRRRALRSLSPRHERHPSCAACPARDCHPRRP